MTDIVQKEQALDFILPSLVPVVSLVGTYTGCFVDINRLVPPLLIDEEENLCTK